MKYELQMPPVFVCGVQRSGTTLLVKMLSKNEAVEFLPQETHLYPLLWNPGGRLKGFSDGGSLAEHIRKVSPEVNYGWTKAMPFLEHLTDSIKGLEAPPKTVSGLLRFYLYCWQEQQTKKVITGEKTPAHIYYTREILREFPECKIILMCRDPRAAALSEWIKLEGNDRINRTFSAFNFIVRWATAVALIQRYSHSPNVLFIRYEDLIESPAETLKKVSDFSGITFSENMLDVGVTNSSFSDKKQAGIGFNTDNLTRWKTDLPAGVIAQIEQLLGDQMKTLNYTLSGVEKVPVPWKKRLKLSLAKKVALMQPAAFHHYNRNKKYR